MKDYYKILQVASDASPEVIQMAYKALAKKYHPDLNPGQEEAMQEKMKDLNEAYEILSDKDKRWQYNQSFYQNEESSHYSESEPPRNSWTESSYGCVIQSLSTIIPFNLRIIPIKIGQIKAEQRICTQNSRKVLQMPVFVSALMEMAGVHMVQ